MFKLFTPPSSLTITHAAAQPHFGLKVLDPPEPGWTLKYGTPNIDIVAVHGLNGDSVRTWTYSDARERDDTLDVHWLRDLLPYKVPRARIMIFGYHASIRANPSAMSIKENAQNLVSYLISERQSDEETKRPILWVGHSLGGILIKQALICAADNLKYSSLCPKSSFIMFFGTPHRGSSIANWANQLALVARATFKLTDTYIKLLKENSKELEAVSEAFIPIASGYHIVSFYEELKFPTLGKLIVMKHSAVLGLPNEEVVMMNDSDHCSMCRFKSLDDPRFSLVWKRIQRMNSTNVQEQTTVKLSTAQKDCLASLFDRNPSDARDIAASLRYSGTNGWIIEDKRFCEWKQSHESCILWILGSPGHGKTVLTASVLDHLDCTCDVLDGNSLLIFFFWKETDHLQSNAMAMYRSLLWQLLKQRPSLFRHVIPEFEIQRYQLFQSVQSLARTLTSILDDRTVPGVFVVLDALDECDAHSRHYILHHFSSLLQKGRLSTSQKLKIFITSRTYDGICRPLEEHPTILLTPENLQSDISYFVKQRVLEIAKARHYEASLAAKVENFVSSESNGMFLWASLVLRDLEKTPIRVVDLKLKSAPKDIWRIYDSILRETSEDLRETIRDILVLVVTALRPLMLSELAMVMQFQNDTTACPRSLADFGGDIQLCAPILIIREGFVHLVHQSAKDFLIADARHTQQYPSLGYFGVKLERGHAVLAEVCLNYLNSQDFKRGPLEHVLSRFRNDAAIIDHHSRYPLLAYSATYWFKHARSCEEPKQLNAYIQRLADGPTFMAWFQIYWFSVEAYLPYPPHFTPLHMAAHFHLSSYLEELLSVDKVDAVETLYYGTLLHAAAWVGNSSSVELLLKFNANVDIIGGRYGTALQAAAGNGHIGIVETILKHGATLDLPHPCGAYGNPLLAASLLGYHQVVRLLLVHGAQVNTFQGDSFFDIALKVAAEKDHKRIVDRLLSLDADKYAQTQSVDYGTALQKACENGQDDVVELLLTSGMETDVRKDSVQRHDYGTALQAAVAAGHIKVVKLLLDAGADIEARGERNGTALLTAASLGHSELVQILISAGAQFHQVFGGYGSPLMAASANGRLDVVKQLLEAGVDINQRGGCFGSALRASATFGHDEVIDVLLAAGAEDSGDEVYYGTALEAARENNHLGTVSKLVEHHLSSERHGALNFNTPMSIEELLMILQGDWREYYFYGTGNRARDEGEAFVHISSEAVQKDPCRIMIKGKGKNKWGTFIIEGTATRSGQLLFEKEYKGWGWTYRGILNKCKLAMGGSWSREGTNSHGTFVFHKVTT